VLNFTYVTEVYVIKDNINAFNKTLNKPSKAVLPCWTRIMRFCRKNSLQLTYHWEKITSEKFTIRKIKSEIFLYDVCTVQYIILSF